MRKDLLQNIIFDQRDLEFPEFYVLRNTHDFTNDKEILVISGVRRCGKSTLLHEIRQKNKEKDYYLNFDDDRLIKFTVDDFQQLYELFIELFGIQKTFYFDEIQNIEGWERFVRRLHDYGNKVYITGSNASMLSKELGTHLTGRFYQYELYPFSFSEYLNFKRIEIDSNSIYSSKGRALLNSLFSEYFKCGGFPAFLKNKNPKYLKSLYESILYRDVMVRNHLTNEKEILELVYYLTSNIARPVNYISLAKITNIKNSTTIKNYLGYLQSSYILFVLNRYDVSLKKQLKNPKKVYFIDLALIRELGFQTSEDKGRLLENLVFIELKRRLHEVYYYSDKHECDFVIKKNQKIVQAIQVSWTIEIEKTRNREINGLLEAMEVFNLSDGLIITKSEEDEISINGKVIHVIPIWKWLIQNIYS
ncbi:MAG: ATP-binding protein [Bacteroidales bacterium]|nr:ATP-binding protein [Bacteroidales bacterium]